MTNIELTEYYQNLLIIQYKTKTKAPAHITALIDTIMIFELIENVQNAYEIDTSIGTQLDVLGKYLGLSRTASIGTTTVIMTDSEYRNLLKFKIIQNFSNYSLGEIDQSLFDFFGTAIKLYDNFNMTAEYILFNFDMQQAQILVNENLLPIPAGVRIDVIISSGDPFTFFDDPEGSGFGAVSDAVNGGDFSGLIAAT